MIKQEEIREGIEARIRSLSPHLTCKIADDIVAYLHSQGVAIKADRELLWQYETCKCCTREQRLAWSVTDELWNLVVLDCFKLRTLCLECFLRMADDNGIDVNLSDINLLASIQRDKTDYIAVKPLYLKKG